MPLCLGASGSVRASTKIQLARCPAEVQIFWPLITHSSPSSTARQPEVAEVGAGVGLGVALAPEVLAREDPRAGSGASARRCPTAGSCCRPSGWRTRRCRAPGGHAGPGELLGEDHLLERGEPAAAVLRAATTRPGSRGRGSVVAPLRRRTPRPRPGGRAPMPFQSGGQVLGEEGLDLLPVRLGLGRVGGIHRRRGYCRAAAGGAAHRAEPEAAPGRPRRRRRADRRRRGRPGRIVRPAAKSRRARAVELGLGGGEERRRRSRGPPSRRRRASRRSSRLADRRHGPADQRAGALDDRPGRPRPRARPVMRGDGRARRLGLEAARGRRTRTRGRRARRSRGRCGRRCRRAPSSRRPSSTMPPPTPVDTTMAMKSRTPGAAPRPSPRPAPAPWRRCRRGRAARSSSASRPRSGKSAPAGDVERRHRLAARASSARRTRRRTPPSAPARHGAADVDQRRPAPANSSSAPRRGRRSAPGAGRRPSPSAVDDGRRPASCRRCRRPAPCSHRLGPYVAGARRYRSTRPGLTCPGTTQPDTPTEHQERRSLATQQTAEPRGHVRRDRSARSRATSSGSSRARPRSSSSSCCASSPRATSSSRTCPASARPAWPRRWPRRSTASFGRVQFTPDLLPSDVVGRHGVEPQRRASSSSGPARSSPTSCSATRSTGPRPKTQSALLEAMAEGQVTVDGATYPLGAAVHGDRHPEPDRARGHLPAAREPARPVPHAGVGRLPVARRRARRSSTPTATTTPLDDIGAGGHRRRRRGADRRRPRRPRGAEPQGVPRRPGRRDPPPPAPRARHVAAGHARACSGSPGPGPPPTAAPTSCPTTSRRWPSRCSPTASSSPPRPSSRASPSADALAEVLRAGPGPRRHGPDVSGPAC